MNFSKSMAVFEGTLVHESADMLMQLSERAEYHSTFSEHHAKQTWSNDSLNALLAQ